MSTVVRLVTLCDRSGTIRGLTGLTGVRYLMGLTGLMWLLYVYTYLYIL